MLWNYLECNIKNNKESFIIDSETEEMYTYENILDRVDQIHDILSVSFASKIKCAILCKKKLNECVIILACLKANLVPVILSENYGEVHCLKIIKKIKPDIAIVDSEEYNSYFNVPIYNIFSAKAPNMVSEKQKEYLNNVALIMCTSGTTGVPKGVMISDQGLQANIQAILEYFSIKKNEKILISRPLYHCAVLTGEFFVALVKGLDIVFYDGKYDLFSLKRIIDSFDIKIMCGTPTIFNQLSKLHRGNETDQHIKTIALSGECLTKEVAKSIRRVFPNANIYNVYGLTENSPRVSFLAPEYFDLIPGSVGKPLRNTIIRVVDNGQNDVETGTIGNIIIKSESIMMGYYKDGQATSNKIKQGYLWTGDMGYKDADDNLYILGRADDMIIKAGLNIYPKEVEDIVLKCEFVEECMAYGVKECGTEQIQLDVVLNKEVDVLFLRKKLFEMLPTHLFPDRINVVDVLRKNASGKMIRGKIENKKQYYPTIEKTNNFEIECT